MENFKYYALMIFQYVLLPMNKWFVYDIAAYIEICLSIYWYHCDNIAIEELRTYI